MRRRVVLTVLKNSRLRFAFILGIVAAASVGADEPFVLWTDQPDMALIVEIYNASHDTAVTLRYHNRLASALIQEAPEADIVVGTFLNTSSTVGLFSSLRTVYDGLEEEPFPALVSTTFVDSDPVLLPLAFGLPAIAINPEAAVRTSPVTITMEEIERNAGKYNRFTASGEARRLAFVPMLDPTAKYVLLRILGTDFTAGEGPVDVAWDNERLGTDTETLFEWTTRICGSRESEHLFLDKYLYDPIPRQFERNRIAFAYFSSPSLLAWNDDVTTDFRWLADADRRVPVLEDIVWAGIPATAGRPDRADEFLKWLMDPETQEQIIRVKIERRIERFGLFGRLSTIDTVNRLYLAALYPRLQGRILSWERYIVPRRLPRYWDEALDAVLIPLLANPEVDREGVSGRLEGRLSQWYLQRGD